VRWMAKEWSNLARIVYKRTYARRDGGPLEDWEDTVHRAVMGNVRGRNVPSSEVKRLFQLAKDRKSGFAGRGWWFSGAPAHQRIGGAALCNCWFLTMNDWENYVIAQDLLMLGGGVGLSVEHKYVSKLPRVKKGVSVVHKANSKDADFIVPDSREGWCKLTRRVLEAFFVTGRSFDYSTVCIRGYGERINGFGGVASGPLPLIRFVETLCGILSSREGRHLRPVDAADLLTTTGEMVVSGNVRRSAIIILGDAWDKDYLRAKRWDLGTVPTHRACANYSIITDDIEDVHPLFWQTYEHGEPFGIVNLANIKKYGRMGELRKDSAQGVNPCAEATLEDGEPCNLVEQAMNNMDSEDEFIESSRLWYRAAKRVTLEKYHHDKCDEVIKRNRRVGVGITGCLASPLFTTGILDRAYAAIQAEDESYSKELGVPRSIRTTVVKPSGTMSKVFDCEGYEGIHPGYSRYIIQRIRFATDDALVGRLRAAGHRIEPVMRFDGSLDQSTSVVDFYVAAPEGYPVADEDWDTWKQLDVVKMVQKHWCDQSASVTVYYKREEIPQLKAWLADNLQYIKTISFLCHSGHEFKQAPKEAITREQYEKLSSKIKPLEFEHITEGALESQECEGGVCPVR
jgi:ribonucleoside-triphosphate reductase (thioredoxin)